MTRQQGYPAEASASILEMLNQARAAGRRFSHTERVLRTSCEFWVAAVGRTLDRYLGIIPDVVLRNAEASFAAIDISLVADILRAARINPLLSNSSGRSREVVARLQCTLDYLDVPVDDMIRRFAVEQTLSRLKRPTFRVIEISGATQAQAQSQ